ncbi:hypothetical protein [Pelagibius sp. Alg239-R121]|uniref:hypothetical protein n=1 Tax=Pelagibius sp. Alg239-R121 TaxID=2993448 RepID=UPI0024A73A40|nr:hypothetical protein [Pelagibius sp. Alg239-R121]
MRSSGTGLLPNQEAIFYDYAQRLQRNAGGRRALHARLSKLQPDNRREHHLRIAQATLDEVVRLDDGALFRFGNDDLVIVCGRDLAEQMDEAVKRLSYFFSDDPLLNIGSAHSHHGDESLCKLYLLDQDYDEFVALAQGFANSHADELAAVQDAAAAARARMMPLKPNQLGDIATAIAQADLSSMMQRQSTFLLDADGRPEPVFREIYFSIDHLQEVLIPGHDILANRWLFQDLTRHLDRRMISLLVHNDDDSLRQSYSLNLNVSTLLSSDFLALDETLNPDVRRSIVIEFQLIDVFADVASFLFARDFLRERGYNVCLDGTTHLSLPFVDRKRLGFDMVKLLWDNDFSNTMKSSRGPELRAAISEIGPDRVILSHCGSEDALQTGKGLGLSLYQGFHIDRLRDSLRTPGESASILSNAMARHRASERKG